MSRSASAFAILAVVLAAAVPAQGAEIHGVWKTERGDHVKLHPCGSATCITVVTGEGKGLVISRDLVHDGSGAWTGSLFNPEDERTYSGSATLIDEGSLRLKGCALKIFCRSQVWTRVR